LIGHSPVMVKFQLLSWQCAGHLQPILTGPVTMSAVCEGPINGAEHACAKFVAVATISNLMKIRFEFAQKARCISNNSFSAVCYGLSQRQRNGCRGSLRVGSCSFFCEWHFGFALFACCCQAAPNRRHRMPGLTHRKP
jgi:hypothetical protein